MSAKPVQPSLFNFYYKATGSFVMKMVCVRFTRRTQNQHQGLRVAGLSTVNLTESAFPNEAKLREFMGMAANYIARSVRNLR
jgi:predicted secreted protein